MTVAFFIAATVVTILQYIRMRERRLLPLMALFALMAMGHSLGDTGWGRLFQMLGGTAGLVLLVMLTPRHPPHHG